MNSEEIKQAISRLIEGADELKNARMLQITDAIRVLASYNKNIAGELFDCIELSCEDNLVNLCYYLLASKAIGKTSDDVKNMLETVEKRRIAGEWSKDIWVNALALRSLGEFGISYPNYVDSLLKNRLPNGSWFNKIWVTSFALMGLYYCKAEKDDLRDTILYLKNHLKTDHWSEYDDNRVKDSFTTSLTLESLLLVGEGYEESYMQTSLAWCFNQLSQTDDIFTIARLLVPLTLVDRGHASAKTCFHPSNPVVFRETKVSIGTQVQGDYVQASGDFVTGDKVDRKLGDGAIDMKDAVIHRSQVSSVGENRSFKVCPYCGEKLDLKKTPKFCPYCGEEL